VRTVDDSKLRKKIFEVWDEKSSVKKGEHLASLSLLNQDGYGENLLLYDRGQKKRLRDYATNLSAVNKNGIVVRNSDIRALPSAKPYFLIRKKRARGFPLIISKRAKSMQTPLFAPYLQPLTRRFFMSQTT